MTPDPDDALLLSYKLLAIERGRVIEKLQRRLHKTRLSYKTLRAETLTIMEVIKDSRETIKRMLAYKEQNERLLKTINEITDKLPPNKV